MQEVTIPRTNPGLPDALPRVHWRLAVCALTSFWIPAAAQGQPQGPGPGPGPGPDPHAGSEPAAPKPISMQQALERASLAHPDLGPQRSRISIAEADVARAKAGRYPQGELRSVFGIVNGISVGEVPAGLPQDLAPVFSPTNVNDLLNDLGPFTRNMVRLDQPLYTFGKIRNGVRSAETGVEAEGQELARQQAQVRLEVKRIFYGYLLAQQLFETFEGVRDNFQEAVQQAEARLDDGAGEITQSDVLKLRIATDGVQRRVLELGKQKQVALLAFRRAIGAPLDEAVVPAGDQLRQVQTTPFGEVEALEALAPDLPAYQAAQKGLDAREAAVAVARSQLWPDLFLSVLVEANWAGNRDQVNNPYLNDDFNRIRGGPFFGIRWKLDFAAKLAALAKAKAEAAGQQAQLEKAKAGLPLAIRRAYLNWEEKREALDIARRSRKSGRALSFLTAANFRIGIGDGREILEAYGLYARSAGEYIQAIYEYNMAVAELGEAAGQPLEVYDP